MQIVRVLTLASVAAAALAVPARADVQALPVGHGDQGAVVISSGPNGLCDSKASPGDVQNGAVGQPVPNRAAVRCGANKIVETVAAGDDRQLVALGATCRSPTQAVVDSGADGVAQTAAGGDDAQLLAVGVTPTNAPCILTGGNGVADTNALLGDDVRQLGVGKASAHTAVVRCGPNLVADTTANDANPSGDDVQVLPVGTACTSDGDVVIDAGADGIADTRAVGPDVTIAVLKAQRILIPPGRASASKTVKLLLGNPESGPNAAPTRTVRLIGSDGTCPSGTVTQVDADAATPGLQATALMASRDRLRASAVVTLRAADITSVSLAQPYRCTATFTVKVDDPALNGAADDAGSDDNTASLVLEVGDRND
jgi:hypothetical protein